MKQVVAVDAGPAARHVATGTEVYAREVVTRLPHLAEGIEWRFYAPHPGPAGVDLTVLPQRRLWAQSRLPVELAARPPDLLFVPAHAVPFAYRGRALTTVHDLAFERFPEAYPPARRTYLRLTTRWAARRCPRLLAVSEATRADLAALYGVDEARVDVIPNGVEPPPAPPSAETVAATLRELEITGPFALHVGRVETKKNQAAALAAAERAGVDLVMAGAVHNPALAERLRRSPRARLLGRVDGATLEVLYRSAECLVFPSLYEGFGMPVLEAMVRGLPVVTVSTSSLGEAGGEAAIYAEGPDDIEGLAAGIGRARGAERAAIVAAGHTQAGRFSWDRTAVGVLDAIHASLGAA